MPNKNKQISRFEATPLISVRIWIFCYAECDGSRGASGRAADFNGANIMINQFELGNRVHLNKIGNLFNKVHISKSEPVPSVSIKTPISQREIQSQLIGTAARPINFNSSNLTVNQFQQSNQTHRNQAEKLFNKVHISKLEKEKKTQW